MKRTADRFELHCPSCGFVQTDGVPQMLARLRKIGMFKRARDPTPDTVVELFVQSAGRLRCDRCEQTGLLVRAATDDWDDDPPCQTCGGAIAQERRALFPGVTRCAACQATAESTQDTTAEFCPRCGAPMSVRLGHGSGVTRYVMACPHCRARK